MYLCYDGDNAGINATNKTNSVFNEISIKPNIIIIPDKLDQDDRNGRISKFLSSSTFRWNGSKGCTHKDYDNWAIPPESWWG